MIIKIKEYHLDKNGDLIADYNLFLSEFTKRIEEHIKAGHNIKYVSNNNIRVDTGLITLIYQIVVLP